MTGISPRTAVRIVVVIVVCMLIADTVLDHIAPTYSPVWVHLILISLAGPAYWFLSRELGMREQAEAQREAAQEALRLANEQLEQRVRERTSELIMANQTLEAEIAERRQVEETLRIKNNAIESSINGIAIADMGGRLTYVNPAFLAMWGFENPEQVLGKSVPEFWQEPKEVLEIMRVVQEKGSWVGELEARHRQGMLFDVELAASVVKDEAGNPIYRMASFIDISERKQAEEALRRAFEELEQRVQERAAIEERQRLARELHDSVSQALYGISLGAHTARALVDETNSRITEALDYVIGLAAAGLTEMRALIFELRPESLATEGLVTALAKQIAALRVRLEIKGNTDLGEEPDLPIETKQIVYRIAQEALHNAAKHARATRLDLRLSLRNGSLELDVCDDGIGFDPDLPYPGHLGLRSMRERAAQLGVTLQIESSQGRGTQVSLRVPVAPLPSRTSMPVQTATTL